LLSSPQEDHANNPPSPKIKRQSRSLHPNLSRLR
jgi:hypothetical protein